MTQLRKVANGNLPAIRLGEIRAARASGSCWKRLNMEIERHSRLHQFARGSNARSRRPFSPEIRVIPGEINSPQNFLQVNDQAVTNRSN